MYGELRSPNVHEPRNMAEFTNTVLGYKDSITSLWAGGTYLMSQEDFYPTNAPNVELISLDNIEELHHFLRNDRYVEFGAMVSLNEVAAAGQLVLPRMLLKSIKATASQMVREHITVGGALCTPHFRTAISSTLMLLDSSVELRYPVKNRMHSKWFHISRIYDKNGHLSLPPQALLSKVRITITQPEFQYFNTVGSPLRSPESSVSLAASAKLDQNNISSARLIITIPSLGFCCNRDIDNSFSQITLPLDESKYLVLEAGILSFIRENLGQCSRLQEARLKGMLHEMITELNQIALSL